MKAIEIQLKIKEVQHLIDDIENLMDRTRWSFVTKVLNIILKRQKQLRDTLMCQIEKIELTGEINNFNI